MKKVINFVKGKRDEKKDKNINTNICVEITNPLGQKVPSEDEHIVGLQSGYGYEVDFSGKDKSMTKLHKAAWQGNLEKVKIHLKKFDINAVDEFNRTPLHLAAAQGHTNVVCFLLNNKAVHDISDSDGMTPFLKAVDCGVKECVSLMVEKGVSISSVDNNGNTALHITARQGFFNIMSILLKNGASCNSANNAGEMALHIATEQEHRDLVELLLQAGAQVNVVDAENRTPLMLAARVGQSSIVSLLLKYGAHLDACDNNGWTAEDYSMIGGHEQLALELKIPQDPSVPSAVEVVEECAVSKDTKSAEEPLKDPESEPIETESQPEPEEDLGDSQTVVKSPPYVRRRSLMALGTLESHRNSFVENGNSSGNSNGNVKGGDIEAFDHTFLPPAVNITVEGDADFRGDSDADWDSDDSLPLDRSLPPPPDFPDSSLESCLPLPELVLTPDPSLPPQIPELIITPDRRSRITLERTPSLDLTDSEILISPDGTLGREGTMKCSDEIWETANIPSPTENTNKHLTVTNVTVHDTGQKNLNDNTFVENANVIDNITIITNFEVMNQSQIEVKRYVRESQSLDNLDDCGSKYSEIESSQSCDKLDSEQFSGVYSLETEGSTNEVFTQSLDSLEEESPIGTVVKRNVFHESHSLELLDEAKKPSRHHARNKSVSVSSYNWSKSVDVLSKPSKSEVTCLDARSIDEQLQCYDEALRELAEEQKVKEELLNKVLEGRPYAKSNLNQSLSCDMLEPKTGAVPKTSLSLNQRESSRTQRVSKSSVKVSSLPNAIEGKHQMKKSNTVDVLNFKYCSTDKTLENNVRCWENYSNNKSQKLDQASKEGVYMSRAEKNLPPVSQKYSGSQKPLKQRSNSTCSRNKISSYENNHKFYNSLELPPRNKKGKGSRSESNFSGISDWKRTLTVSSMPERQNEGKNFADTAQSSKTPENIDKTNGSPKRPTRVKKLRKELSDTTYTKKNGNQDSKRKSVGRSISLYMERMKYDELPKKPNSELKDHLLCEKSESDSDWSDRSVHNKRKQFGATRDAIVDSEDSEEDPPFWVSTGKEGGFSRQDTVIHNQHAAANTAAGKKDSDEEKSGGEGNEEVTSSSDSGSASMSQSDATPSHSFILKSHHSMLKDHLKQTTEEKAKLEEAAAKLKEQNDRIQYDLADANQSIVVRDDKIVILQDELSRLSSKYSTTLDELNMLKQRLTTAEIELRHLRDFTRINIEKEHNKPDPSTQQLMKQLHETNKAKKRVEFEKETLIAQHIMDIKKLQQDTIHWKNLYEEALSKLEQIEALCDPCLMENNQHIDKIKAAFKKFRDEKNSGRNKTKIASTANQICIDSKEKSLELEDNLDNKEVYCLEDTIIDNQVATLQLQLQQEKSRSSALENQVQKMLIDLQKKLDLEAELENLNRRLEKEFVPRVEMEQLRANQETAIARIRQQALLESETKLNAKLTEINQILQLQLQEQSQKERQREIVESQMKQEFENTRQKLLLELSRVQAALKAKESEERVLREQCDTMTREAEKAQELKRRQLIEKSYSVNLADPSTTREKELTVKRSVVPPPPPPPPLAPPPLDLSMVDANSLRQQLERSISKHRDIHMSRVNDDRSHSPPGRSQQ